MNILSLIILKEFMSFLSSSSGEKYEKFFHNNQVLKTEDFDIILVLLMNLYLDKFLYVSARQYY